MGPGSCAALLARGDIWIEESPQNIRQGRDMICSFLKLKESGKGRGVTSGVLVRKL